MHIQHIGQAVIRTPYRDLTLNPVLHVPKASNNLAYVHRIASDNNVFFELHPNFFLIKDRELRKTLLQGKSKGGFYPLPHCSIDPTKQVIIARKVTTSRLHSRLGHPSSSIVRFVLSKYSLPSISDSPHELVCDACQ
jgi:hypothetical protein